ncbi:MAG TPA: SusC/RagA family TonB-linked outer membrane protein [Gemmatimonadaceae bacterium]|nr:SusC/RagA family TonB-linked outer membrane protein [Gemmatimonadaceae bacterium]
MPLTVGAPNRTSLFRVRTRGKPQILLRALLIAGAASVMLAAAAAAQGVVAGTVTDADSHQPVVGAQVSIPNTTLGSLTDEHGHFHIGSVRGTTTQLIARRIGYESLMRSVTVGDTTISLVLTSRPMSLSEVVVTGTPGGATKREIGNAVTTVDAAAITKIAPVQSFQQLIAGRAPNVTIMPGTGEIGSGAKIRVRGTSSLGLGQVPLMYADGVRMDNDQATGPENQAFGAQTISRWNDIDPEDIERVEIIKGPSAATLYGTEASNGVLQILTKTGQSGPTQYSFSMQQGANWFMNPQGRFPTNYNIVDGNIESIDYAQLNQAYKNKTGDNIFNNGWDQKYHLGISGGSDKMQYYFAGVRELNNGVEPSNWLDRTSGRANVTATPTDKFKISAHLSYLTGRTHVSPEAGYGGRMWTTYLMNPSNVADPNYDGFGSNFPYQYDQVYDMYQDINRFTGSVQITNDPWSWFSHRLTIGADQVNSMDVEGANRVDSLVNAVGSDALGYRYQTNNTDAFRTFDYSATAKFNATKELNFATSVGAQYYTKRYEYVMGGGTVFAAQGLQSVGSLTQGLTQGQDVTENRTLGYYAQEQIAWKDRRYFTLALRSDKNSAFGVNYGRAYYPKASVSWVLSDEPFWHASWMNSFRFRAAYGETGQQPNQFDALRTYAPTVGPGDQPALTPLSLGNASLGPERGKEFETGFEASMFHDRVGLEFTYYNKRTTNAILDRQVAPSVGFALDQFVNAGQVSNKGVEGVLRATPVQGDVLTWDASFSMSYNKNNIDNLGIAGVDFITPGTYQRDQAGYPVGAWFERKVVSATIDPDGTASNIMCDNGAGGTIDCADAPAVYLGNSIPSTEGAFTSTFTLWGKLKLYGLVDFQLNQQKLDGNRRIVCYFEIGGLCKDIVDPQHADPIVLASFQESYPGFLIVNSGFAKLREISASYSLPETFASRLHASAASITVAGRNLHTWTSYKGLEPEAQFLGSGSRGSGSAWEQTALPILSSFVATLNITF